MNDVQYTYDRSFNFFFPLVFLDGKNQSWNLSKILNKVYPHVILVGKFLLSEKQKSS